MAQTADQASENRRLKARRKTEDKAFALIAKSGVLQRTISADASSGSYFSLPSGRVMRRDVCERLIACGRLTACRDGLFGDSQTYIPVT